ncbi:MAG TPA: cytochrome C oxidase subunit IV family protein [Pyrinomonadaceae bacterium]|jgi:cytochrome c oxidase subunit 4|nr:cytochrome C oxidase subunit IV family protein [Pyrinomonadaceae bacterium]
MSEHIVSKKVYFVIFGALMLGTLLTVLAAFYDMDEKVFHGANTVVALTIAVIKATLVVLYFMHVRYSSRLTWVIVIAGFFWMGIMFALTFSDYWTRPTTTQPKSVSENVR